MGFSISTVRRSIEVITEIGLLIKEPRYDRRGFQTSNIYTLIRPSSVPEDEHDSTAKDEKDGKKKIERKEVEEYVPREHQGCSERASRVLSENSPGILTEQPGCSVETGGVSWENNEEYPSYKYPYYKYPSEKDPSVRQSVNELMNVRKTRSTDRRIYFFNYNHTFY